MNRTCECGASFEAKRNSAFYCSPRCRQRAHRADKEESAAYWKAEALKLRQEASKPKPTLKELLEQEGAARLASVVARYPWLSTIQIAALNTRAELACSLFWINIDLESSVLYMERPPQPTKLEAALSVLGLRIPTTREAIDKAYRAKAKGLHPDINPGGAAQMSELNGAYAVVKELFHRQTPAPVVSHR
jgi:hypothetical protein